MDQATSIKRHTQLWSAGETTARRIGIGGAIFAVIILLTVIERYHIESAKTRGEIATQESDLEILEAEQGKILGIQKQLIGMSTQIENQPWTNEIQELKDEFAAGEVTEPVIRSRKTLDKIANELRNDIIAPLRVATTQLSDEPELAKVPDKLDGKVVEWLAKYEKIVWWDTLERKDQTASAIGEELTFILKDASADASGIKKKLEATAAKKAGELKTTKNAIVALEKNLQAVMDRALPIWARGILNVTQLFILFPWLLAGITIYLVGTALRASRHFHAMADGEGWSAEERRDPLLSTAWTLTPRGVAGSIATFATYGSVLVVLGACLYRNQHPPTSAATGTVQASVDAIATQSSMSALVTYAFFVAAMAVVIVSLVRHQHRSETI